LRTVCPFFTGIAFLGTVFCLFFTGIVSLGIVYCLFTGIVSLRTVNCLFTRTVFLCTMYFHLTEFDLRLMLRVLCLCVLLQIFTFVLSHIYRLQCVLWISPFLPSSHKSHCRHRPIQCFSACS
jgi:hypothetical protein